MTAVTGAPQIACEKCKAPASMEPAVVHAYPRAVVLLGYVIWWPAAFGLALMTIAAIFGMTQRTTGAPEIFIVVVLAFIALPFLALGMFLSRKRKLWRCRACGYAYERV